MNSTDPLDRLFRAASRAHRALPVEVPAALEQRVLASWRRGDGARAEWLDFLPLFRRGLAFACVVFIVAVAWSYHGLSNSDSDDTTMLNASTAYSYFP
jgi:hypothetical protein